MPFQVGLARSEILLQEIRAILNVWSLSVVALNLWVRTIEMAFCRIKRPTPRRATRTPNPFSSSVILGRPLAANACIRFWFNA